MRWGPWLGALWLISSGCTGFVAEQPDAAAELPASDASVHDAGTQDAGPMDAGGADAGAPDAGVADAGAPDAGRVAVFVAVGKQGRRAVSCDDGRTWTNDVAVDDAWPADERYRCFSGSFTLPDGGAQSTDCDHNAYSSTSLAFADGVFVTTMGWGAPGTIFRSTDGVTWTQVDMGANATDVMFAGGRFIAATRYSRRSDDQGRTWTMGGEIDVANGATTIWNVRGGAAGGGVFLVTAQDGSNLDFAYSSNGGMTWQRPTLAGGGRVDVCGAGHPAFGNGVFVTASSNGGDTVVCRSGDGAATWSSTTLTGVTFESRVLWTGSEFLAWSNGQLHRSSDGASWTSQATQTRRSGVLSGGPALGAVAQGANGTFVATRGGWQVWYEQQRFYRSTDGVVWDELAAGTFEPGHPITAMAAGEAERSAACP